MHRQFAQCLYRGAVATSLTGALVAGASAATAATGAEMVEEAGLLSDPFLQLPGEGSVHVVWNAEFPGNANVVLVGEGVGELTDTELRAAATGVAPAGIQVVQAATERYSRLVEDSSSQLPAEDKPAEGEGIVARDVWRHQGLVTGLETGGRTPYRVVSLDGDRMAASETFTLAPAPRPGDDLQILLTSDHQAMVNTPANLQKAAETLGPIDAVFFAGDLINQPDRASEWFDDQRGGAFFPVLQGNAERASNAAGEPPAEEDVYHGGEIIQHAPLYPAVGNHEVQGRIDGHTSIGASYDNPVPRDVAAAEYEKVKAEVNPEDDPAVKESWIEDNSFSTTTYEEMFTLPDDSPGDETYYATTVGDVRLVSLFSTRIWRDTAASPDPSERTTSRYQEAQSNLDDPLAQGYGEFVFESLEEGSEQLEWLEEELASEEFQNAEIQVVMLHEGPQGLGGNVMPHFTDPVRIEETDAEGNIVGVRYEYPAEDNMLLSDLQPRLEEAGVDLVYNGHNHLWNRFEAESGTHFLESSNTGNTYGAFHESSGRERPVPPEPWDASNYVSQGNPGGLEPLTPSEVPMRDEQGEPLPFVSSNDHAVFAVLDTGAQEVVSYSYDVRTPEVEPIVIDRFSVTDDAPVEPEPEPEPPADPESTGSS